MTRILFLGILGWFCATGLWADERLAEILSRKNVQAPSTPVKGFTAYGGSWSVTDDGVVQTTKDAGPKLLWDGEETTSGQVSVSMYFPKTDANRGGNGALVTHVRRAGVGADAFDGFEIGLYPSDGENGAGGTLLIGRHAQNFNALQRIPAAIPWDQWISVEVAYTPERLTVRIDGKPVADYAIPESERLAPGKIGLRPWQCAILYRDFQVSTSTTEDVAVRKIPFEAESPIVRAWPETLSTTGIPPFLFLKRAPLSWPYAVALDLWQSQPRFPGCAICLLDVQSTEEPVRTIFSDPDGVIYDMNLSLDAKTIFFSYRKMENPYWHLYRIGVDGTGLQQLTDGNYYDVSPCELPDGTLVFVSTRYFGHTVCQPGPSSNLFRLRWTDTAGNIFSPPRIEYLSMNTLSDFSPQLLRDGRILFTRWEYIDRDLTYRQSLWTQNPDGTAYQLFFGNTIRDVGTFWQARPLPGQTNQVVATFAPHHGFPHGAIGLIDRSQGVEAPKGVGFTYITKEFPTIGDVAHEWSYRDPFPLSDTRFLCSFGTTTEQDAENKFRIYLLDREGEKRLLYDDAQFSCFFPIPLLAQTGEDMPATVSDRVDPIVWQEGVPFDSTVPGSVLLMDVYEGIQDVIPRGSVAKIRVLEQVRKAEDLRVRAYDQSPVMSYGTYYAKRYWGSANVEADGSAHFQVPGMREIYFQIVDAEGKELHRMTSAVQVMPGEAVSCIGCHEDRDATFQPSVIPTAARRPAEALTLDVPGLVSDRTTQTPSQLIDYETLVQPVLDKYCVSCHSGSNPDGGYDLTGDRTRFFSMSYDNLLGRSASYRQHDMQTGLMLPEERAKGKPLVHFFWLLWTPTGQHSPLEGGTAQSRLPEYLTSKHVGQEIPQKERERIYFWVDANVPFYATYANQRPLSAGQRDRLTDADGKFSSWFANDFCEVYRRRCSECHANFWEASTDWGGLYAQINLTHPDNSTALTAHLPQEKGGRGISPILFSDKTDADYRKMLRAIQAYKP